tara:strand:- start:137 stop:328 length:192 start_codon:yes stop_codon:yes gene_type:complete
MKYKKIKIPIGYEDIRMFEELADGHRKPFTWTFLLEPSIYGISLIAPSSDKIDVEFIKDEGEE